MNDNLEPVGKIRDVNGTVRIEWDIRNYAEMSEGKDKDKTFYFTSPSFEVLAATWNIVLYPVDLYQDIYRSYKCASIFLEKKSSKLKEHSVYYLMQMKIHENIVHSFSEKVCFEENGRHGSKNCLKVKNIPKLEPEDSVTIVLYVYPTDSTIEQMISYLDSTNVTSEGKDILSTNMEDLYLKQQDCDLKIRVKSREFKVHKAILAARSPVLYSMLHLDMAEKKTGTVDIVDFEPDIFENFLLYLYTGRVDGLSWRNVTQLFTLGDKYDLQYLKKECRKYMLDEMCVDGFCDVVVLATKQEEMTLLKCAEEFFVKNVKSILLSKKWQEFLDENSTVCNELFLKFVSSQTVENNDLQQ